MVRAVLINCLGLMFALSLPAMAARGGTDTTLSPTSAPNSRIIKTFDFEETALGNFDTIPMFWNKVIGRGYPLYAAGKFDKTVYRSKTTSFKLELDGGSVAYQLAPDKLPAGAGADYYILGFVKTTALPHARAQISAWFAGTDGQPLPGTQASSETWASTDGKDDWHVLQIFLPGLKTGVHSIIVQVGLLQPQQLGGRELGDFELYAQDIHGAAWFDDIAVFQLPRMALSTPAPANIFSAAMPVQFALSLSDLSNVELAAALTVTDAAGATVASRNYTVAPHPDAVWTQTFQLPAHQLPQGAYTADFAVQQGTALLARRRLPFLVCAPAPAGRKPAPEFGLVADRWPVEAWGQLPGLLRESGAGLLKVPAWRPEMTDNDLLRPDPPFDTLLTRVEQTGGTVLANFAQMPAALAARLHAKDDSIVTLLEQDVTQWRPYISFLLARYASRVGFWEIGRPSDTFWAHNPRHSRVYATAQSELTGLLAQPQIAIPWNALYDFDPREFPHALLDLRIPPAIKAADIPACLKNFSARQVDVLAVVEPSVGRTADRADFARRVILTRWAKPRAVFIDLPIAAQATLTGEAFEPAETFLVFRTLVERLGGKIPRYELAPEPGVHGYLFAAGDKGAEGTLVLWSDDPDHASPLSLPLGGAPEQVDLLGHATPLPTEHGTATLVPTGTPLLIDHVDARLVQLRAAFALGTPTVPAGTGIQQTTVHLENPYGESLVGKLHLAPPPGWTIDPPVLAVQLEAGGKVAVPVTLRYPYTEFAGAKVVRGTLQLAGFELPIALATRVVVTSTLVAMDCSAHRQANGDLVLQQTVTNTSNAPLNVQAYAMVPGAARQQHFIISLPPGQATIKHYTFPGAPRGQPAVLGLRQTDGKVLLTKSVVEE